MKCKNCIFCTWACPGWMCMNDYDCISYRIAYPGCDEEHGTFAGYFSAKNGEIIPLDGDIYELNEEVIESEEWTMPEEEIQNGLTIVVIGGLIRK